MSNENISHLAVSSIKEELIAIQKIKDTDVSKTLFVFKLERIEFHFNKIDKSVSKLNFIPDSMFLLS